MTVYSSGNALSKLAGPGSIGPVHCAGHEILRRIFVTVRDRNWREVAPCEGTSEVDEARRIVKLATRHTSELVDFEWQGVLHVSEDLRTLRFEFEGTVLRDMDVCRLGLVVLHPVDGLVGSKVTAVGPQGEQLLTVPREISPQSIIDGVPGAMTEPFSTLKIERRDFGVLELRFAGDLFELEDQRNWGDASFKSYCTPLRIGFPRSLRAGTVIAHRMEAQFTPAPVPAAVPPSRRKRSHLIEGEPGSYKVQRFPLIGRVEGKFEGRESGRAPPYGPEWDHVHIEVTGPESIAALRARLEDGTSQRVSIGIEAAVEQPLEDLIGAIRQHRARVARLLIHGSGTSIPTAAALESWRQRLGDLAAPAIPLFAATRGYYVEFNRRTPADASVSGIAFPLAATVHSDDAATITDNAATIRDMAETLRRLAHSSEIIVAPLALYYPESIPPRSFPRELVEPWLAATLIHTAVAGIKSITLAEDVVDAISSPDVHRGSPLLTHLIECAGLELRALPIEAALPRGVHVAAMNHPGRRSVHLLAANLTAQPVELVVARRPQIVVPPYGVTWAELTNGGDLVMGSTG